MKMTLRITTLLLLISTLGLSQVKVSGVITDESGIPLIGTNVYIDGSYDGASTDVNGAFSFVTDVKGTAQLKITYLGYEDKVHQIEIISDDIIVNEKLKESINRMEAVVISAGVFQGGVETKSAVLKPLDIVTTAGATADIAGALNTLPGTQTVGEEGRLFVRGGSGEETKTFIDGLQVLKPYSTTIPNTPTRGRFSPFMFSGTSFSTGGYSAEYGQALSSALILNTKNKPTQTRTDLSLMSVGAELSHTHSWAKTSLAVQGAYYNLKPYFSIVKQSTDWHKEPETMQFNIAARQLVGSSGMIKAYANLSTNWFSIYQADILNPEVKERYDIKNDFAYANTSYRNTIGRNWTMMTGLSGTYNRDKFLLSQEEVSEITQGTHIKLVLAGQLSSRFDMSFGVENLYAESIQDYSHDSGLENTFSYRNPVTAGFVETNYYLSNNLIARVGYRFEHHGLNNQFYHAPRISMSLKAGKDSQFSLAAGRFQQSPTDDVLRINNELKSEMADHLILNYQFMTTKQTFRVEGYIKKYSDLVRFDSEFPYNPASYYNGGNGYARGIDVFWRDNKSIKNADYWISYSYLDTEREYRDYPTKATPSFASTHNLSVVYKQFVSAIKTQFSGTFSYGSPRPYNDPNKDSFNGQRTPAYIDLSLSVSYLATQNIIVHASTTNVLGRENVFGYTYSSIPGDSGEFVGIPNKLPAPRFIFLGVFITFSKGSTLNQMKSL